MANGIERVYKSIGRQIARFRESRDLTQGELGEQISPKLTRAAISNIEAGRQRLLVHTLIEIARVLQVAPQELLPSSTPPSTEGLERELAALGLPKRTVAKLAREVASGGEDA